MTKEEFLNGIFPATNKETQSIIFASPTGVFLCQLNIYLQDTQTSIIDCLWDAVILNSALYAGVLGGDQEAKDIFRLSCEAAKQKIYEKATLLFDHNFDNLKIVDPTEGTVH